MASTVTLIQNLSDALESASTAFPSNTENLLPPIDGISLLDVKNEILLSYLQNLVFLILLRLKNTAGQGGDRENLSSVNDDVVKKLIELRVWMERGVRPLEGKLRYQIDKVLRAADDADRASAATVQKTKTKNTSTSKTKTKKHPNTDENDSSEMSNVSGASGSESDSDEAHTGVDDEEAQELMYRPNAAALAQRLKTEQKAKTSSLSASKAKGARAEAYKPPRITPTAMPSLLTTRGGPPNHDNEDTLRRRRRKANLVDEYINEELATAPQAQPSIGSNNTILQHGRSSGLSHRDRQTQKERTEYEEANFMRLPLETKAERRKARARNARDARDMFGGEDWTGLGGLGDRIHKSVARTDNGNKRGESVLERRDKRKRATEDMPRGDGRETNGAGIGVGMGDAFERRKRIVDGRAERKRRRKD